MIEKIDFSSVKSSVLMGVLLSIIIIALVSSSMFFRNIGRTDSSPASVDFSTFPGEQNIGAEIPPLIYADENIAMSFIGYYLIIYDFKSKSIVDSVDMSFFRNEEFNDIWATVTKDGKIIRFSRADILYGIPDKTVFEYSIKTHTLVEKVRQELYEDLIIIKEMQEPYKSYFNIDEQFCPCYAIDVSEDKFAYLSSESWLVKDLYIGIIDKKTEKLEKYNLFEN